MASKAPEVDTEKSKSGGIKEFFKPGGVGLILIAFLLAIGVSLLVNLLTEGNIPEEVPKLVGLPGTLWLRTLRAVVLPLIISSMILAMWRLRRIPGAGSRIARYTISYYLTTTILSVIIGIIFSVAVMIPNITPVPQEQLDRLAETDERSIEILEETDSITVADQIAGIFQSLIPANVVGAMANGQLLSVIVTGIVIGLLVRTDENSSPIVKLSEEIERLVGKIIRFIILLAPIGVFFLLFSSVVVLDLGPIMQLLALQIGTQLGALGVHWLIVYPTLYVIFVRKNPFAMWSKFLPAPITALGTSSSAATLPVTMKCASNLGVPTAIAKFMLPLGMTVNMDGAGISFQVTSIWMATAQNMQLDAAQIVTIAVLATLGAIGASPIPNSGIALLLLVAESVNIPTKGFFALIVAGDIILDRIHTAVNVSGDLYGSMIVTSILGKKGQLEAIQALQAEEGESDLKS